MSEIDAQIDGLTSSVVHRPSGRILSTRIVRVSKLTVRQKSEILSWRFDWANEVGHPTREVMALLAESSKRFQGLTTVRDDAGFVFVNLLESAPHNVGQNKIFSGVPGNLFAYACSRSFTLGFDGFVGFEAKSELIEHYRMSLGAEQVGSSSRMIIGNRSALTLVKQYFKEPDQWPL